MDADTRASILAALEDEMTSIERKRRLDRRATPERDAARVRRWLKLRYSYTQLLRGAK